MLGGQQNSSAESATDGHKQRRPMMEDLFISSRGGPRQLDP